VATEAWDATARRPPAAVVDDPSSHPQGLHRACAWIFTIATALAVLICLPHTEHRFLVFDRNTNEVRGLGDAELHALETGGWVIHPEEFLSSPALRAAGERATSGDDFLPREVLDKPASPTPKPLSVSCVVSFRLATAW
jgi:hypothetical protein